MENTKIFWFKDYIADESTSHRKIKEIYQFYKEIMMESKNPIKIICTDNEKSIRFAKVIKSIMTGGKICFTIDHLGNFTDNINEIVFDGGIMIPHDINIITIKNLIDMHPHNDIIVVSNMFKTHVFDYNSVYRGHHNDNFIVREQAN